MKKFSHALVALLLVFAATNAHKIPAQAYESEQSLPSHPVVCAFPESEALLSYAREDAVWPEIGDAPVAVNPQVPAGTYKVVAHSYEDHSTTNDPTQPFEQWQFWAYGSSQTMPQYYSAYTDDIPDDEDFNETVLGEPVSFYEPITALRFVHIAFSKGLEDLQFGGARLDELTEEQKAKITWQSVMPRCIEFIPVEETESECEDLEATEEDTAEDCDEEEPSNDDDETVQGATTTKPVARPERLGALGASSPVISGK